MAKPIRQARFRRQPGSTEVFLVRHGESEPAVKGESFPLVDGHGDPALAPEGHEHAERVADRLAGQGIDAIYVTTLRRTVETAAPLAARHAAELAALDAREKHIGVRGSGRAVIEARHKRELRRHRTDELRSGLAVMAGVYRDALVADIAPHPHSLATAVERIHHAIEALDNNPNETLLMQSLLWSLPSLV